MRKAIVFVTLALFGIQAFSQNDYLLLRKGLRVIAHYSPGSHITFRAKGQAWISGIITAVRKDSVYLTQEILRSSMYGIDTLHVSGFRFAIADIVTMPTLREQVVYRDDQVAVVPGDEHFLWVRNGLLFQLLGGGAMALKVTNDLIGHDPPFAKSQLSFVGIAGGLFILGTFMHLHFDPYLRLGKKYRLEWVQLPPQTR